MSYGFFNKTPCYLSISYVQSTATTVKFINNQNGADKNYSNLVSLVNPIYLFCQLLFPKTKKCSMNYISEHNRTAVP